MSPKKLKQFRCELNQWYRKNQRKLPWRVKPSLYKTIVSEFMLQQTLVDTVVPYFNRWMLTLPDLQSLAGASEQKVLKLWEGLGYYSRARNLHKLSRILVKLPRIPKDYDSWKTFPGIGPYTAAAITSISFNTPAAVVDGNVIRVLSRLTMDKTRFQSSTDAIIHFRDHAQKLLDTENSGDHNQAMMELGATLCLRAHPNCSQCPLKNFCLASKNGTAQNFPNIIRRPSERVVIERLWIKRDDALLLERAPRSAKRLADIFELPKLESVCNFTDKKLITIKNRAISNQRIKEKIYSVKESKEQIRVCLDNNLRWISLNRLRSITLSGPHRRWINELINSQ